MRSESIKELATALSKAQGQFDHARKDTENAFFKSRYATLAGCIDAAKKHMEANGLMVTQTTDVESDKLYLITTLAHSSGEWISGKYPVSPIKGDPQAYGSAMTYARRYAFCAITGIASDDDDDGNAASRSDGKKAKPETNPLLPFTEEIRAMTNLPEPDYTAIKDKWHSIGQAKAAIVWKMLNSNEKKVVTFAVQGNKEEL